MTYYCQKCGDGFLDNRLEKNMFCSKECRKKQAYYDGGDQSTLGIDKVEQNKENKRDSSLHKELKKEIGECEVCGKNDNLEAHHIIPKKNQPKLVDEKENIAVLCKRCHASVDNDRYVDITDEEKRVRGLMFLRKFIDIIF